MDGGFFFFLLVETVSGVTVTLSQSILPSASIASRLPMPRGQFGSMHEC